jgi:hypothetical protein
MQVNWLQMISIKLVCHFFFNTIQDELGFFFNYMTEILMIDLQLEWIEELELFPSEGIVELIAVVNPAF